MISNLNKSHIFAFESMTSSLVRTVTRFETEVKYETELEEAIGVYAALISERIECNKVLSERIQKLIKEYEN